MSLDSKNIIKIANLAKIAINDDQIEPLRADLDNILHLVEKMNNENTGDIAPLAHPFAKSQPLRPDQVTETNERDQFLKNAPQTTAGLYIVPQVIETE